MDQKLKALEILYKELVIAHALLKLENEVLMAKLIKMAKGR